MATGNNPRSILKTIVIWSVVWCVAVAVIVLQLLPDLPNSTLQWVLFVVLGPLLYLGGEALFDWLFSQRHGRAISSRGFSLLRVGVALPVALVWLALIQYLLWLVTKP